VLKEFRDLKEVPVSTDELVRAKAQLKGSLMLSHGIIDGAHEQPGAPGDVLRPLLRNERDYGEDPKRLQAEDVLKVAQEFFIADQIAVTVLGNLTGLKMSRDQIDC